MDAARTEHTPFRRGAGLARRVACAASLAALLAGCAAEGEPIDCTVARVDERLRECPVVRRASEFPGCLRRGDVGRHACVVVDADLTFCDDEPPMPITAFFDSSHRTLDCAGGAIDHGWGRRGAPDGEPATPGRANLPLVRFVEDRSLSDVTIRNCALRGTLQVGVQMTRFFGGQLGGDGVLSPGEPEPVGHRDVLLQDLRIEDVRIGVYLGNYSRDVTLERVAIDGTERIAVYSEAGSRRVRILDSVIANNRTREAVALDSTSDSEIARTLFANNREGALNLYRNCGELLGSVCPVVRATAPNGNRIVDNAFVGNGLDAVRIASRQGRRHRRRWCADLDGRAGRFTDTAEDNLVAGNTFRCDEGTALVVMDGPNRVADNRIVATGRCTPYEVSTGGLGRRGRHLLDGLVLEGNRVESVRPPRLRDVGPGVRVLD